VQQALDEAIAARAGYDTEFRLVWPDGAVRWLIAKGRVYSDQAGVPLTMIGVNMDVSARKQSEAALQQAEKLAVAGRLAASVAHEINNPLASVTNLVYLIQTHSATVPQVREYANLAQAELTRVAHVVRQTLGFYREPAAAIPVRVADVLENVFALHGPQLRAKSIALEKQYRDHAAVTGHPGELRQLFSNLVTNAIEALPQGGRLRVRISGGSPQRPGVRVIVADNGVGIPPDQLRRVFEPFFTTKGERGTGLGLWVSHSIVDKHGGRIRVRSRFGRGRSGTVFQVFLPQEQAEMETVAG
jgi:signal transduction histidine kinase